MNPYFKQMLTEAEARHLLRIFQDPDSFRGLVTKKAQQDKEGAIQDLISVVMELEWVTEGPDQRPDTREFIRKGWAAIRTLQRS